METSRIDSGVTTATAESNSFGQMKSEDFFALLISELQNQDPFNPNETSDMINQVSQIRNIELSSDLTSTLSQMTDQQRSLGTAELIGKYVEGEVEDAEGNTTALTGVVTGVVFGSDGEITLELDTGQQMPASALRTISSAEHAAAAALAGGSTTTTAAQADTDEQSKDADQVRANTAAPAPWFSLDSQIRL
jgi:flagellar hook assembly protein FlgD